MFGTDYLANQQLVPQFELLDSLDLPAEVQQSVYRDKCATRIEALSGAVLDPS